MSAVIDDPAAADDAFAILLPPRPYPGLRAFDESEWPIFFGRERMVDAVVARLVSQHLVVVHGDSGSGKSSLIRAGVLPRLRQEQARGGARWRTVTTMPRGGPLRNLARALAAVDGRADDADRVLALRRALNQGRQAPTALADLLQVGEHDPLCLLIDQFEELFEHARLQGAGEARLLTDALVAIAEAPPPGLHVAVTMRSEYLGACARFPGLAEAVNIHQYLLPPMTVPDLLRAIREPARLYGGEVEAALAERLAADAANIDGLPLVQHALMLMQREHAPLPDDLDTVAPWRLTLAHYPEGGLAAQLSRHADAVAQQAQAAAPERERLVEDLFRALTAVNAEGHAVRRPQPLAALAATLQVAVPVLARAIDEFRAEGVTFLAPRGARPLAEDDWIDICHEALIRGWQSLADPRQGWLVSEFRNGLVWRALLVQAESFERDRNNVLSPATTEERVLWLKRRNPVWAERYGGGWDRVQALIEASERSRQALEEARVRELAALADAQRNRRRVWAAVGVLALALGLSAVAVWQWRVAVDQSYLAKKQTRLAKDQSDLAKQRATQLEQAQLEMKSVLDKTTASANELSAALRRLDQQAEQARTIEALRRAVHEASVKLTGTARTLEQQQTVAGDAQVPRIYVHIGDESQREAARAFVRLLGAGRPGDPPLVVLGPELKPEQRNNGVFRCFRSEECADEALTLLRRANGQLAAPELKLQDLSPNYNANTRPRPHHYEIWFGHEVVRLAAAPPGVAASR